MLDNSFAEGDRAQAHRQEHASLRMIGAPRNPPAEETSASSTVVARQCTRHGREDNRHRSNRWRQSQLNHDRVHNNRCCSEIQHHILRFGDLPPPCAAAHRRRMETILPAPRNAADRSRAAGNLKSLLLSPPSVPTVVVGGITRLTESGLSITEWEPLQERYRR